VIRNRVLLVLVVFAAAAALMLPFMGFAPNRLATPHPLMLAEIANGAALALALAAGIVLAAAVSLPPRPSVHLAALVAALALALLLPILAGAAARGLVATATPIARASLASGFWVMEFAAVLACGDALRRLEAGIWARAAIIVGCVAVIVTAAALGAFDALSLAKEAANRHEAFIDAVSRHALLVGLSVAFAVAIGVPLGVAAYRRPRSRQAIFGSLDIVQTIPSIALFGRLIGPLAALAGAFPFLRDIGISGIGVAPAVIALTLYSLLPMARGAYAGLASVPPSVIETARGMGMTAGQILAQVEAPIALPVLLSGLRIVTVQAIGLAVVAALIGAGGLGSFVFLGLGQRALDLMLLGAVPTIMLALAVDLLFQLLLGMARRAR